MTYEEKLEKAYPCYGCKQVGTFCAYPYSDCFGDQCGRVPYTGKGSYERLLKEGEENEID